MQLLWKLEQNGKIKMAYPKKLKISPNFDSEEYIRVTPENAGWEHLNFAARKITKDNIWESSTKDFEMAVVFLGGEAEITSDRKTWAHIGGRSNVFSGLPYTVYIPRNTNFKIKALTDELDLGYGWAASDQDHPMQLVSPEMVQVEIRGGGNVTRQINDMVPPGFDCHRLVVVEVYTPSGNWSSYPPHKHDRQQFDEKGNLVEADLEEIYFYKIDKPQGFAYQRIYTKDGRIDELMLVRDNELVLSPEGYHPVVSAPGYTTYYLNILAGSAQSLASNDDPDHAWVKNTYKEKDPRLPIVTLDMK